MFNHVRPVERSLLLFKDEMNADRLSKHWIQFLAHIALVFEIRCSFIPKQTHFTKMGLRLF